MAGYVIQSYGVCKILLGFGEGHSHREAGCGELKASPQKCQPEQ